MRRLALPALLGLLGIAALAAGPPDRARAAGPFTAVELSAGGVSLSSWLPGPGFLLFWEQRPADGRPEEVEYRIRSAEGGAVLDAWRGPYEARQLRLTIPGAPGVYTVELRLGGGGGWGPWTAASVRFDNTRPGLALPRVAPGWVANPVRLSVEPPAGPLSPAGIRGYAVAVGARPGLEPCAMVDRCEEAELDLPGGIGDTELNLGNLSEGTHYVNVAAVSGAGLRSTGIGIARVDVDAIVPAVSLAGVPTCWASGPVRLRASTSDLLSGTDAAGAAGPYTAISVDGGPPTLAAGPSVATTLAGDGVHRVEFYARDAAGNVGDGRAGAPPPASSTVRIDAEPPLVRFLPGPDPEDPERIEALVSDRLSGPAAAGTIAVRPAGGAGAFAPLPTTATAGRLAARWDSDSEPAGTYEFQATARDRAGNSASGSLRTDGARMVLASRLKHPVAIRFGFGGKRLFLRGCDRAAARPRCRRRAIEAFDRRPASRALRYGRRVPVSGILTRGEGAPLPGRRVVLVEALASGATRARTLRTNADGAFSARLARGPSRAIEARFGGDRLLSRARGRPLRLTVRSAVRLSATPVAARIGGAPVAFRGRVGATASQVPPQGLAVELQFRLPGLPWSEFRTVRSDRRGRFHYRYAFTDDDSRGVRFLFRARVPTQPAWPYAAGTSLPVAVTGR